MTSDRHRTIRAALVDVGVDIERADHAAAELTANGRTPDMTNTEPRTRTGEPAPGPIDVLNNVVKEGLHELGRIADTAPGGHTLANKAVEMFYAAANDYAREIDNLDTNWARLEEGAADHRLQEAAAKFDAMTDTAGALAQAADREIRETLEAAAIPAPPKPGSPANMELRDELRMIVGNAQGDQLGVALIKVAQSPRRDLASLIFSTFGESLIESRGGVDAQLRQGLRAAVIEGSAAHGAPAQQTAAQALAAASKAHAKATVGAREYASTRRGEVYRNRRARPTSR